MAAVTLWTGVESKALRLGLRMTVEAFAERLGAGVRTVANWEARRASIKPQPDLQAALDTLLERSGEGERARFWVLLSSAHTEQINGTLAVAEPATPGGTVYLGGTAAAGSTPQGRAWAQGDVELPRVPFLPAVLERTALDWLLHAGTICSPGWVGAAPPAGADDDGDAATALRTFRWLDHRHGSGRVHGEVDRYIADRLSPMIERGGHSEGHEPGLHAVAVGFYELSGYQAVDMGADGVAQRRYLRALQLSQAAGDRTYGAYLLAVSLGHLALHCNHPEAALRVALAAVAGGGAAASPATRAALHAVVARAHARRGHVSECTAELVAAEVALGRSVADDEPAWIRYFTPAYLADEMAHCFYDLDDHVEAQRSVDLALAGLGPGHLRRLTIDTALLASSLAAEGRLDHACRVGRAAVDHAAATDSQRCIQRIVAVRVGLEPHRDQRNVREFLDYLHHALPLAA